MESRITPQLDEVTIHRVEVIQKSLRGFVLGLFGVIPIIGIAPAIGALLIAGRVRSRLGRQWNPASGYLLCGGILAAVGLIVSALLIGVLVIEYL